MPVLPGQDFPEPETPTATDDGLPDERLAGMRDRQVLVLLHRASMQRDRRTLREAAQQARQGEVGEREARATTPCTGEDPVRYVSLATETYDLGDRAEAAYGAVAARLWPGAPDESRPFRASQPIHAPVLLEDRETPAAHDLLLELQGQVWEAIGLPVSPEGLREKIEHL